MEITIDFETRSVVDLKKHGLFVYREDQTTDAICLGVLVEDEEPREFGRQQAAQSRRQMPARSIRLKRPSNN